MEIRVDDLKITLILQNGRFLLTLFFKRVLKSIERFQFRVFSIVSDFSGFHLEVCHLKEILKMNAFNKLKRTHDR